MGDVNLILNKVLKALRRYRFFVVVFELSGKSEQGSESVPPPLVARVKGSPRQDISERAIPAFCFFFNRDECQMGMI